MQVANEIVKLTRQGIRDLLEGRRHADQAYAGPERRHQPRWPFPGTVEIWPAGGDGRQRWLGTCRDISEQGLGMSCEAALEPGTLIEIALHLPEATFCGHATVRYCAQVRGEYVIGAEFQFTE